MGLRNQDFQAHMLANPKITSRPVRPQMWPTEAPKVPTEAHCPSSPPTVNYFSANQVSANKIQKAHLNINFPKRQNFRWFVLRPFTIFHLLEWGATRLVQKLLSRNLLCLPGFLFRAPLFARQIHTHWPIWASYAHICPRGAPKVLSCDQLCDTFGVPRAG